MFTSIGITILNCDAYKLHSFTVLTLRRRLRFEILKSMKRTQFYTILQIFLNYEAER
jgi:hypothetical protein